MKRILMQIYTKGSVEAVELYQKAFDADVGYNVKSQDGTLRLVYAHADTEQKRVAIERSLGREDPLHRRSVVKFRCS